jgi:DNA anti-recombination protein RmuC
LKSAYEKAMERAEKIYADEDGDNSLEIREELKDVMGPFFKGKINAEELWEELKNADENVLAEAQLMIVESIGLRNSTDQIKRRQEAVIALESLRKSENSSYFEKAFTQAQSLQQQYETQKKQLDDQVQQALNSAQGQQNPLAAQAGSTNEEDNGMSAQMQQQLAQKLSEFQKSYNQRFDKLIEEIKAKIK